MGETIKFLKIAYVHNWLYANRDRREVSVAVNLGWDVNVLLPDDVQETNIDGYKLLKRTTRPLKKKYIPVKVNQIIAGIQWAKAAAGIEPDIISGHNLIGCYIGLLSNHFRKDHKKAKIVYDAHEYTLGEQVNSPKVVQWFVATLEKYVIRHSSISMYVNDSIADAVQNDYKLKQRPLVIRNVPFMAPEVSEEERLQARTELEQLFGKAGGGREVHPDVSRRDS